MYGRPCGGRYCSRRDILSWEAKPSSTDSLPLAVFNTVVKNWLFNYKKRGGGVATKGTFFFPFTASPLLSPFCSSLSSSFWPVRTVLPSSLGQLAPLPFNTSPPPPPPSSRLYAVFLNPCQSADWYNIAMDWNALMCLCQCLMSPGQC